MARAKKLTDIEFLELVINKELEIANAPVRFKDIMAMPDKDRREWKWFQEYTFDTLEQFLEWRQFFFDHFYDWQPKRESPRRALEIFRWYNLQWGLKYNFDYTKIAEYDKEHPTPFTRIKK